MDGRIDRCDGYLLDNFTPEAIEQLRRELREYPNTTYKKDYIVRDKMNKLWNMVVREGDSYDIKGFDYPELKNLIYLFADMCTDNFYLNPEYTQNRKRYRRPGVVPIKKKDGWEACVTTLIDIFMASREEEYARRMEEGVRTAIEALGNDNESMEVIE